MNQDQSSLQLRAAAIEDDGSCDVDALLAEVVRRQRLAGRTVAGLLMTYPDGRDGCASPMVLVDIETGDTYAVSQVLGGGSTGCRADPQGFARASTVLRHALETPANLVVSNRFGKLEVGGGGFRNELLELLASDRPVLTVVASVYRPDWEAFTGGAAVLAPDIDEVGQWLQECLGDGAPAQAAVTDHT